MTAFSFQSCMLEEDLSSLSTPGNYFRKFSECQSSVNACYIPIKSIYTYAYMLATECVSDIAYCPSGTLDARLDISPSIPRFGSTVWTQGYLGVQRCNFAIEGIQKCKGITEEQRNQLLCEAKGLRGFFYLTLTSFFGDVPFYFDDVTRNEVLEKVAYLPRMSAIDTRKAVIDDLKDIAPLAKQQKTIEDSENRAGAAFAYMVIAKCAMWNACKDAANAEMWWNTALDACKAIEKIYGKLSDYDYAENVMFRNKNTAESIFEIQHTYTQGGLVYTSNVASICMPQPRTANSCIYDGVEIPELGDQSTVWAAMRPNVYFSQGLQSKMGKDIRKNYNMAWSYDGHEFKSVSSRPWMGPKFWCPNLQGTSDGNNYKMFRFADVILMMAECYNELGQDETAVEYLNQTRVRAGIGEYTYRTPARLRDEIRNERGRELIGEFQRKYDLVRWGIFYQAVLDYSDYQTLKDNIKPCHEYYPIPDNEVVLSKYALDNKEYEKYGL